jgi:hypothetical protein
MPKKKPDELATDAVASEIKIEKPDWRKLIDPAYIVLNTQCKEELEKQTGKLFEEIDPTTVEDKYKLILLAGIKEVAQEREFDSVDYDPIAVGPDYAAVKCTIRWRGNKYGPPVSFSALADVQAKNESFAADYMIATAENRAFIRAVRSFLLIHITGKEEIDFKTKRKPSIVDNSISKTSPLGAILDKLQKHGKSFEDFISWWAKEHNPLATSWKSPENIPSEEQWLILSEFQELEKKKKNK